MAIELVVPIKVPVQQGPYVDVDMDGVSADFTGAVVRIFNKRHGLKLGFIDTNWREYRIEKQFKKPVSDLIYEIIHEPGFFAALEPYPDAEWTMSELARFAAHIEICSAPPTLEINGRKTVNAYAAADKIGWLFRQFHDLALSASVTLTTKKHRIRTDVLIDDDLLGNVIPWCLEHPRGLGYLVARPWNEDPQTRGHALPPNLVRGPLGLAPKTIREWWTKRETHS